MMKRDKIAAILKAVAVETKTGIDVYLAPAKAAAACIVAMACSASGDPSPPREGTVQVKWPLSGR